MLVDRLRRVMAFRPGVFSEIAADDQATWHAVGVVAVVTGVPALLHMLLPALLSGGGLRLGLVAEIGIGMVMGALAWVILTGVVTLTSRFLAQEPPRFGRLFRVIGFAYAPLILMIEPFVGAPIAIVWFLALLVAAVREACGITTGKAIVALLPLLILLPPASMMMIMMLSDRVSRLLNLFG